VEPTARLGQGFVAETGLVDARIVPLRRFCATTQALADRAFHRAMPGLVRNYQVSIVVIGTILDKSLGEAW